MQVPPSAFPGGTPFGPAVVEHMERIATLRGVAAANQRVVLKRVLRGPAMSQLGIRAPFVGALGLHPDTEPPCIIVSDPPLPVSPCLPLVRLGALPDQQPGYLSPQRVEVAIRNARLVEAATRKSAVFQPPPRIQRNLVHRGTQCLQALDRHERTLSNRPDLWRLNEPTSVRHRT